MPTPAPHKNPHQTQWEKVKLGDIAEITAGQSPQSKFYSATQGMPFLQGSKTFGFKYPTIDTYTTHTTKIAKKGSILISVRAPVGDLNFAPFDICIGRGLASIEAKVGTNQSLWYILKFNLANILRQKNLGTTFDSISKETLQKMNIIAPPLPTQENIAQILSTLDKKIELNTRINTELESMAKLLYTRYFVEFNFPDSSGKPYKASGGAMVYSPTLKREIPKDWEVIKLANRFNFERGEEFGTASYKESKVNKHHIKFYRVGDMIDDSKCVYVDSSKENAPLISENDLLVSFDGSVGRVAYGLNGTYSSGIRKITDKHGEICQSGLYFIFTDSHIQHTINQHATGTNIKHAGSAIENLYMPYSKEVFSDFQNKINSMFALMRHTKAQSQRLAEWRDYLLPLLMGDQVEVV